jgi:glyoxylase-like metal-dependent hydrolase (beta-lactamase superfamily II)
MMIIKTFPSGPYATNAYILSCRKTAKGVVIDPSPQSAPSISEFAQEHSIDLHSILLTHSHWDHISDVAELKKTHNLSVYIHKADAYNLEEPGSDGIPLFSPIEGVTPTGYLEDDQEVEVGTIKIRVITTPGHSPGGVSFYLPEKDVLFSGDTLFQGSIGTLALPTANPKDMWDSLDKLAKLPVQTVVYPGHGRRTTIGDEEWLPQAKQLFGDMI